MNERTIEFNQQLLDKVSAIPNLPGVYQYFDIFGKVVYVGKAKNLRNRVRSYFHSLNSHSPKTLALLEKVVDLEIIIVDSEAEALILEDNLIKRHKPRYNILLKDDKTYPFIKITNEDFPKIYITRKVVKDGSKYLGPYTEVNTLRKMVGAVCNIFKIRRCRLPLSEANITQRKFRACLDFHINRCQAPCIDNISQEEYSTNVYMAMQVLMGKTKGITQKLTNLMNKYSENLDFEKAASIRDRLLYLGDFVAKQKVLSTKTHDRDIFGISRIGNFACTLVFIVREGKLIGKRHFFVNNANLDTSSEILQRTLESYYLETDFVPNEIVLPNEIEDLEYITEWLSKKRVTNWNNYFDNSITNLNRKEIEKFKDKTISIKFPKTGEKRALVEMANNNAKFLLQEYINSINNRDKVIPHIIYSLQRDLNLPRLPRRIECYDNSHIQGSDMVSSMVVFIDGSPKKSEYRKFKAKDLFDKNKEFHNDDFAMMRETIYRRFSRAIEEDTYPDLVIVDGGKGQLSSAYGVLCELGVENKVPIIGLAKRLEEVFFPLSSLSTLLPKTSSSLKLIQNLRDEAHRFAITFHRDLRSKRAVHSQLDDIKGIGKVTQQKLLDKYNSVTEIKKASNKELATILNTKQIENIMAFFRE